MIDVAAIDEGTFGQCTRFGPSLDFLESNLLDLDLSTRTNNVLVLNEIYTVGSLLNTPAHEITTMHGLGTGGIHEIIDALLLRFVKIPWLPAVAASFKYETVAKGWAIRKGYGPVILSCTKYEYWILEHMMADLKRNGFQDWHLVPDHTGSENTGISIYRKGYMVNSAIKATVKDTK